MKPTIDAIDEIVIYDAINNEIKCMTPIQWSFLAMTQKALDHTIDLINMNMLYGEVEKPNRYHYIGEL